MKMILLKDVPGLGRRHEVKEVSPGYARNYLIPRKLAQAAAEGALSQLAKSVATEEAEEKIKKDLLKRTIETASGQTITARENANELGHLFAGIHTAEISEMLRKQLRIEIPADYIILEKPIKEIGTFEIPVKADDIEGKITLFVEKA